MSRRRATANRTGLAIVGIALLVLAAYLVMRSFGLLGNRQQATDPLYNPTTARWVHQQHPWIWIVVALAGVVVALLALRWLLAQLRTDGLGRIAVDTDNHQNPAAGRTVLPAAALTAAVQQEIKSYPGVQTVTTAITGRPDQPQLRLKVTIDPDADLPALRNRIVHQAIAHARTALDCADLPTQLQLAVGTRTRPKGNIIQ